MDFSVKFVENHPIHCKHACVANYDESALVEMQQYVDKAIVYIISF